MKEPIDIVAAYERAVKENTETALATVVLVEGSAYRRTRTINCAVRKVHSQGSLKVF